MEQNVSLLAQVKISHKDVTVNGTLLLKASLNVHGRFVVLVDQQNWLQTSHCLRSKLYNHSVWYRKFVYNE